MLRFKSQVRLSFFFFFPTHTLSLSLYPWLGLSTCIHSRSLLSLTNIRIIFTCQGLNLNLLILHHLQVFYFSLSLSLSRYFPRQSTSVNTFCSILPSTHITLHQRTRKASNIKCMSYRWRRPMKGREKKKSNKTLFARISSYRSCKGNSDERWKMKHVRICVQLIFFLSLSHALAVIASSLRIFSLSLSFQVPSPI